MAEGENRETPNKGYNQKSGKNIIIIFNIFVTQSSTHSVCRVHIKGIIN